MGTFAQGDVSIYFEKEEDANKVHDLLTVTKEDSMVNDVEQTFKKFLGEEEGRGHYSFYNFAEKGGNEIYFEFCSERVQNAEWQMDQLIRLLKELIKQKEIEGVSELNSSLMMDTGCGVYMEGSEFEEGGE